MEIRVRRFYTFGTPLALSIFRKQKLIDIVLNHKKIGVEELGFSPDDDFSLPRWVNYWDKDDVCAYPVSFLYQTFGGRKVVEDKYMDVSDCVNKVHEKYFHSKKMAKDMAEVW